MPHALAIHRADVDVGDQLIESVGVIVRRGEVKLLADRRVVRRATVTGIDEPRRERVYVLHVDDGPAWVVDRGRHCGCGDGESTADLAKYRT